MCNKREATAEWFHDKWIDESPKLCRSCEELKIGCECNPEKAVRSDIVYYCENFPDGCEPEQCDYQHIEITPSSISSIIQKLNKSKKYINAWGNLDIDFVLALKELNEILEEVK